MRLVGSALPRANGRQNRGSLKDDVPDEIAAAAVIDQEEARRRCRPKQYRAEHPHAASLLPHFSPPVTAEDFAWSRLPLLPLSRSLCESCRHDAPPADVIVPPLNAEPRADCPEQLDLSGVFGVEQLRVDDASVGQPALDGEYAYLRSRPSGSAGSVIRAV